MFKVLVCLVGFTLALCGGGAKAQVVTSQVPVPVFGLVAAVTTVSATPGRLGAVMCDNINGVEEYVMVYDAATTAAVTLGTTIPKQVIPIGASNTGPGFVVGGGGFIYLTGIQVIASSAVGTGGIGHTAPSTAINCNFGVDLRAQ